MLPTRCLHVDSRRCLPELTHESNELRPLRAQGPENASCADNVPVVSPRTASLRVTSHYTTVLQSPLLLYNPIMQRAPKTTQLVSGTRNLYGRKRCSPVPHHRSSRRRCSASRSLQSSRLVCSICSTMMSCSSFSHTQEYVNTDPSIEFLRPFPHHLLQHIRKLGDAYDHPSPSATYFLELKPLARCPRQEQHSCYTGHEASPPEVRERSLKVATDASCIAPRPTSLPKTVAIRRALIRCHQRLVVTDLEPLIYQPDTENRHRTAGNTCSGTNMAGLWVTSLARSA